MKIIVLIIFILFIVAVLSMIFVTAFSDKKTEKDNKVPQRKNVQNYKVRFDAAKEQYYIVNQLETYDEPVTNCFGFRVMYKDKPKAEFVVDKLNS